MISMLRWMVIGVTDIRKKQTLDVSEVFYQVLRCAKLCYKILWSIVVNCQLQETRGSPTARTTRALLCFLLKTLEGAENRPRNQQDVIGKPVREKSTVFASRFLLPGSIIFWHSLTG